VRLVFQVCSLVRMSFVNGEHLSLCQDQFNSQKCLCQRNLIVCIWSLAGWAHRVRFSTLQGTWQNIWVREKDSNKDFHRFDYFGDCARDCYIVQAIRIRVLHLSRKRETEPRLGDQKDGLPLGTDHPPLPTSSSSSHTYTQPSSVHLQSPELAMAEAEFHGPNRIKLLTAL
jgi:hypothetical protein